MKKHLKTILTFALLAAPWVMKAQSTTTLTFTFSQDPLLVADAGADTSVCDTILTGVMLDGSAAGGDGSYNYNWTPSTDLSSATIPNPVATPPATTDYMITVRDGNGCTSTDVMTLTVDTCLVGVSQIQGVASVSLYPNPNKGAFRVNASLEKTVGKFSITINNIAGQEIYSSSRNTPAMNFTEEVNLPGISRGVYTVRMDFDGAVLERKIIVQ
jgi:hypothetical protein